MGYSFILSCLRYRAWEQPRVFYHCQDNEQKANRYAVRKNLAAFTLEKEVLILSLYSAVDEERDIASDSTFDLKGATPDSLPPAFSSTLALGEIRQASSTRRCSVQSKERGQQTKQQFD